jgi:RND family efflux transporter MFP subunit
VPADLRYTRYSRTNRFLTFLVLVVLGVGCESANRYVEPPPPEVTVTKPTRRAVTSYMEYTGTTGAVERIDLRARVRGFLKKKLFKEGADVKAGQLLLVIDEEPFQVKLEQVRARQEEAEAALKRAEESKAVEVAQAQLELDLTQLALSRLDEARSRALIDRRAGTREELEKSEATRKKNEAVIKADRASLEQARGDYATGILVAKSTLLAAKAEVRNAQIELGYCRVTAPIDGRTSRSELDVGNFVGDGLATVLATIVKTDPIRAYINVSEGDLPRIQKLIRQEKATDPESPALPMEMGLGDEEGYPHLGHADYTDPVVDQGTGTVRIRGVFPNLGSVIAPGQFVRVRMPIERREDALLVPSRALGFDQIGEYLLVVDKDNLVQRRSVKAGTEVDGMRVVDGMIDPADRVVVDGLLRARPGLKVNPKLENGKSEAIAAVQSPPGKVDQP